MKNGGNKAWAVKGRSLLKYFIHPLFFFSPVTLLIFINSAENAPFYVRDGNVPLRKLKAHVKLGDA